MNDFTLPSSMNEKEKQTLLSQLENLIQQTYNVEKEYIALTSSYNQLQALIRQIIEALPNALWVLNGDGTIFLQNSEAEKLEGLLPLVERERPECEIAFEGRHYLVKSSSSDGRFIVSATDITEQKRKERLASMGQMAAHLAHEIRNPIGSIALLLSTLSKRVVPKNQPIVEEIRRALFRVERIIKTTLLYSKGIQPVETTLTLEQLKEECAAAVESYSYTKPIRFRYDFDEAAFRGDLNLLGIALQNLLFNAIDAVEEEEEVEEGEIAVTARAEGSRIVITVTDNGVALPDARNLFEAFHTTKTKGHGLGLVLTRQIAQAHGGDLRAYDDPKRFELTLPRAND